MTASRCTHTNSGSKAPSSTSPATISCWSTWNLTPAPSWSSDVIRYYGLSPNRMNFPIISRSSTRERNARYRKRSMSKIFKSVTNKSHPIKHWQIKYKISNLTSKYKKITQFQLNPYKILRNDDGLRTARKLNPQTNKQKSCMRQIHRIR